MFGDWYLVMAAYNSGPAERVASHRAHRLRRLLGLEAHALPKETENYVPIIIALALVAKAPAIIRRPGGPAKTGAKWKP